jgi:hypothetical protein
MAPVPPQPPPLPIPPPLLGEGTPSRRALGQRRRRDRERTTEGLDQEESWRSRSLSTRTVAQRRRRGKDRASQRSDRKVSQEPILTAEGVHVDSV